jgi:hypothetical protein
LQTIKVKEEKYVHILISAVNKAVKYVPLRSTGLAGARRLPQR